MMMMSDRPLLSVWNVPGTMDNPVKAFCILRFEGGTTKRGGKRFPFVCVCCKRRFVIERETIFFYILLSFLLLLNKWTGDRTTTLIPPPFIRVIQTRNVTVITCLVYSFVTQFDELSCLLSVLLFFFFLTTNIHVGHTFKK